MRIDSSTVGMESARTYQSSTTRRLSASIKTTRFIMHQGALHNDLIGNSSSDQEKSQIAGEKDKNALANQGTEKDETQDALEKLKNSQTSNAGRIKSVSDNSEMKSIEQIRQRCIFYLWSLFFGQDKASDMADKMGLSEGVSGSLQSGSQTLEENASYSVITIQTSQEYSFEESEETSFSTTGTVKTADGREINFNVDATMSRSFSEYYKQEGIAGVIMCDPLVINLDDSIAGLSDQKFYFDLDVDGEAEEISTLEKGNGFLALDQNGDGIINDGSELFGTKSGDGFRDLAGYDEDGNGWIDENDSVYEKLRIWVKDENGEDQLYSLKDKEVGAIYLGSQETDFTLRSGQTGAVNGAIRRTGVFLYENGAAGTVSHLDIAN